MLNCAGILFVIPFQGEMMTKKIALLAVLAVVVCVPAFSQQKAGASLAANASAIPAGATVYISPMDGFESYLSAAFLKKHVPLVIVADKDKADFVITGTAAHQKAGWAKMVFMGNIHSNDAASITLTNAKTSAVAFAYAVDKKNTMHGEQTAAEACAKHLKSYIEKQK
jgi:hypothetical protein